MDESSCMNPNLVNHNFLQLIIESTKKENISKLFPPNTFREAIFIKNESNEANSKDDLTTPQKTMRVRVCLTKACSKKDYILHQKKYSDKIPRFQVSIFEAYTDDIHLFFSIDKDYMVNSSYVSFTNSMGAPFPFILSLENLNENEGENGNEDESENEDKNENEAQTETNPKE